MKYPTMNLHVAKERREAGLTYISLSPFTKTIKRTGSCLEAVAMFIVSWIVTVALIWAFFAGFGRVVSSQDEMLCNSAKVSGNANYSARCACFYAGHNISCINEGR